MTNENVLKKHIDKDLELLDKWINDRINTMENLRFKSEEIEGVLMGYTYNLCKEMLQMAEKNGRHEIMHGFLLSTIGNLERMLRNE